MSARDRAASILGPDVVALLEEQGIALVDAEIEDWQYEHVDGDWCEVVCLGGLAVPDREDAEEEARENWEATGRIRPLYAGDTIDARTPSDSASPNEPTP